MDKITIKVKNCFGRENGKNLRESFLKKYKEGYKIELDFGETIGVTHGFVDELIGVFLYFDGKDALNKLQFSNCNDYVKNMIKFVINDRISEYNLYMQKG